MPTYRILSRRVFPVALFMIALLPSDRDATAQTLDPTPIEISGAVSLMSNGISTIPSFMLGKPAIAFDLAARTGRLSFEPELRFSTEGKPWSFLFPWRYRVIDGPTFLTLGVRPIVSFKSDRVMRDGSEEDAIIARRFLAGELVSGTSVTPHLAVGFYTFYSRGFQPSTQKHTNFVAVNARLHSLGLPSGFAASVVPQLYYLRLDERDGMYLSWTIALTRSGWPVAVSSTMNQVLETEIGGDAFLWNVSLTYAYVL